MSPEPATRRDRPSRPRRRRSPAWSVAALGVLLLLGWVGYQAVDDWRRRPAADAPQLQFAVEGLDCPFWCAVRLSAAIDDLDGARVEAIDQQAGTVVVRHDPERQGVEALRALFEQRGFPVQGVRARPGGERARDAR